MEQRDYDILIFDWDGTLMDSTAWIVECMQQGIAESGLPARSEDAIRGIIGLGLFEAVRDLFPEAADHEVHSVCDAYRAHFFSAEGACSLFPRVEEVLEELVSLGYWMAIATGKSRRGLDKVLEETGLGRVFPVTRTADETLSKPNPLMLEEIITDFDSHASRCLMIGDSLFDLQMANNAGMDALGVAWGVQGARQLQDLEPAGLIHEITELPIWLKQSSKTRVA
jgi:phosphoglycolate phosphatase